jgi:hypothetical protein
MFTYFGLRILIEYMNQGDVSDVCAVLSTLLSARVFGVLMLTLCGMVCVFGIGGLLLKSTMNVLKNITTNEEMNASRYPWLLDDSGNFLNRFDSGSMLTNLLDFFFHRIDYRTTLDLPPIRAGVVGKKHQCNDEECLMNEPVVNAGAGNLSPIHSRHGAHGAHGAHDHNHEHANGGEPKKGFVVEGQENNAL